MIRVIIADDHKLIRDGLQSMLLQAEGEVAIAAQAASGREVLELLEKDEADVVLMDVDMAGLNGIEATRQVRERFPRVKVLMLSMMDNEKFIAEAIGAGAQGYLLKTSGYKELLHAIRTVADGEEYFGADIAKMLLQKMQEAPQPLPATGPEPGPVQGGVFAGAAEGASTLSPRELEVLRLIAKGYTNQQISELLFNSRRTIETHRQNLLEKTGATNTATLILYAASHGLLEQERSNAPGN
jgi:DNA-binding NarL/FixJ family response regulator